VSVDTSRGPRTDAHSFEVVSLNNSAECQVLNDAECLLPYPSTTFLSPDPTTATGHRVNLPQSGMPVVNGPPVLPDPTNELDGFSPTVQILMHFPQGVDLEASDAARLIAPTAQTAGPPWEGVRTYDDTSLTASSPSLLIDADTGERVLHFLELDARAEGNPARQALILRPGKSLTPGHRYIVAMRSLVDPNGQPVEPEVSFDAVRSLRPTSIAAVRDQTAYLWTHVFPVLFTREGVLPWDLVLAFDFVVQSEDQLTRQALAMRDQAYVWLEAQRVAMVPGDPSTQPFTVDAVTDFDCSLPDQLVARRIEGTFESPLFLTGDHTANPNGVYVHTVNANDIPVPNGITNPDYTIGLPCTLVNAPPGAEPARPLTLGHGLFGRGESMIDGIESLAALSDEEFNYIAGATDWRGLSALDLFWVAGQIIGVGNSQLNNFPAFPDRLRQGMLQTLVLTRMMKDGIFNNDPAFAIDGQPAFPGPGEEAFYYGISLGGIMGTWLAALTPDVSHFSVDVPALNFSFLLQRSTQFIVFEALLSSIGLVDPMQTLLGLGLQHELWVSAEPAGYARHITSNPLPGSGDPKQMLISVAWLDKQISNQASEILARTLEVPSLSSSLAQGFVGIPDVFAPVPSAMVVWDTGSFDILDPAQEPFIPPLANQIPSPVCDPHGARPTIPASVDQLLLFLQPGGLVEDTCDGICDAGTPGERPGGLPPEQLCDPFS
jgi:hypothetical protein